MPKKIFLSFLGTNYYEACNYQYGDRKVENVHFVQEACLKLFAQDFGPNDELLFFLTEKAEAANWVQHDSDRKPSYDGLSKRLEALSLEANIRTERIPAGYSEQEIWTIFERIVQSARLESGDVLLLDITHGFRTLPMLALVLVNYLKALKKVELRGIYYGAFEALGPAYKVVQMPMAKRNAPILELSSLAQLQDWANAARAFTEHGRSEEIEELIQPQYLAPLYQGGAKDFGQVAADFTAFARQLRLLSESLATVRGKDIYAGSLFANLRNLLEGMQQQNFIAPLQLILEHIEQKVRAYETDEVQNGLHAVEWCIQHRLTQQGITLLQETIISILMEQLRSDGEAFINTKRQRLSWNTERYEHREAIKEILNYLAFQGDKASFHFKQAYNTEYYDNQAPYKTLFIRYLRPYRRLTSYRNDINHAGALDDARPAEAFAPLLQQVYEEVSALVVDG